MKKKQLKNERECILSILLLIWQETSEIHVQGEKKFMQVNPLNPLFVVPNMLSVEESVEVLNRFIFCDHALKSHTHSVL